MNPIQWRPLNSSHTLLTSVDSTHGSDCIETPSEIPFCSICANPFACSIRLLVLGLALFWNILKSADISGYPMQVPITLGLEEKRVRKTINTTIKSTYQSSIHHVECTIYILDSSLLFSLSVQVMFCKIVPLIVLLWPNKSSLLILKRSDTALHLVTAV